MPFEFEQGSLPLSVVNSGKDTFRITTNTDIQDLLNSLNRGGLINPPVVLSDGEGRYDIVCGYRRFEAVKALAWSSIPVKILPPDTPLRACALMAIDENIVERSLNHLETARALRLLDRYAPERTEFRQIAKDIGLPYNPAIVKKMLALCRLPSALQRGIVSGDLAIPSAEILSRFPDDIAVPIGSFLVKLRLSLHKQREIIGLIDEIAINEGIHPESLLNCDGITEILHNPDLDTPRKAGLVRRYLKSRRFPHLSAAQDAFDALKLDLKLGEGASLTPPAGFESNRYTLSFSFSTVSDIEKQEQTLGRLRKNEEFVRFLEERTR